jgi:hypothetical protein
MYSSIKLMIAIQKLIHIDNFMNNFLVEILEKILLFRIKKYVISNANPFKKLFKSEAITLFLISEYFKLKLLASKIIFMSLKYTKFLNAIFFVSTNYKIIIQILIHFLFIKPRAAEDACK